MVTKKRYRDRKTDIISFVFQPSKLKPILGYFGGKNGTVQPDDSNQRNFRYPSLNDSILIILWRLAFKAEQVHFILVT